VSAAAEIAESQSLAACELLPEILADCTAVHQNTKTIERVAAKKSSAFATSASCAGVRVYEQWVVEQQVEN
jgi:hypothetical protein